MFRPEGLPPPEEEAASKLPGASLFQRASVALDPRTSRVPRRGPALVGHLAVPDRPGLNTGHSPPRSAPALDIPPNRLDLVRSTTVETVRPSMDQFTGPFSSDLYDYELITPVGYGSSAVVYKGLHRPNGKTVGIKIIDLDMFERRQIDELRRETQVMSLSRHPNVLEVISAFVKASQLYLITPYLAGGSCLDIIKSGFPHGLDEFAIALILKQTLKGLDYIHRTGHIHRDVKAGNLLIDESGWVKLADFGVSSSLTDTVGNERHGVRLTFVGTPCWMAPEVIEERAYDAKADIWSFGITALELATGEAPLANLPAVKVLMSTLSKPPPTLDRDRSKHKYSRHFQDLIAQCLQKDPGQRPSAADLLQHPFFRKARKTHSYTYLVTNLLAKLPPLEARRHEPRERPRESMSRGVSWDFSHISTPKRELDHDEVTAMLYPPDSGGRLSGSGEVSADDQGPLEMSGINPSGDHPLGSTEAGHHPTSTSRPLTDAFAAPMALTGTDVTTPFATNFKVGRFSVSTSTAIAASPPAADCDLLTASGTASTSTSPRPQLAPILANSPPAPSSALLPPTSATNRRGRFAVSKKASSSSLAASSMVTPATTAGASPSLSNDLPAAVAAEKSVTDSPRDELAEPPDDQAQIIRQLRAIMLGEAGLTTLGGADPLVDYVASLRSSLAEAEAEVRRLREVNEGLEQRLRD
ncbi:hypothetical protein IWQ60_001420 [Tieghemiomyces parasiticus]|uniref:Protein kinase domain-containing protein n=1 Tax=Tieghemiomyces parasiticus TaxID=78921 RepID=A0A9W8AKQ7_9FUNG|nr:hypothetical protein IWQ60_001420 [Tieghemiomyces parasiticus]